MGILYGIFISFLLTIPVFNRYVFKTPNIQKIKNEARVHLDSISTYQDDGQYTKMRIYCKKVDSLYKNSSDAPSIFLSQYALFNISVSFNLEAEWDEAVLAFKELLKRYPHSVYAEQVFFMSGNMMMQAKEYSEAIRWFERLEMNRPISQSFPKYRRRNFTPGFYLNLDEASQSKEKHKRIYTWEKAKEEATKSAEKEGGNLFSDAVIKIGECYLAMGKSDSARSQFSLISKYFPDSDRLDDMQKLIADSYFQDGELLEEEIRIAEISGQKEKVQSLKKRSLEQYKYAEREYQKFINRYADSDLAPKGYIQLAATKFKQADSASALRVFRDALLSVRIVEKQAEIQLEIGNYYNRAKMRNNAIDAYGKVVQNYPQVKYAGNAQYLIGTIYEAENDTVKAIEAYKSVAENYRNSDFFPVAAYNLALKYQLKNKLEDAAKYFKLIVQLFPNHPKAAQCWLKLGDMAMNKKDWLESIRNYEYVLGFGASSIRDIANLKISDCWKALGEKDRADSVLGNIASQTIRDELESDDMTKALPPSQRLKAFYDTLSNRDLGKDKAIWWEKIAKTFLSMDEPDSALAAIDSAISQGSGSRKRGYRLTRANILSSLKLERYEEAREELVGLLGEQRISPQERLEYLYQISNAYLNEGKDEQAIQGFRDLVDGYSGSHIREEKLKASEAQIQIARIFEKKEQYDKAFQEYELLQQRFPESPLIIEAINGGGKCLIAQNKKLDGVNYVSQKIKDNLANDIFKKKYQMVHFIVGDLYAHELAGKDKDLNFFQKADEYYALAMKGAVNQDSTQVITNPFYSTSALNRGFNFLKWGEASGKDFSLNAETEFRKVREEHGGPYKAAQNELSKLVAKRDWRQAVTNLEKAEKRAYEDYKNYKEQENFEEAQKAVDEGATASMAIAAIYSDQKMYDNCMEKYSLVFNDYPEVRGNYRAASMIQAIECLTHTENTNQVVTLADRMVKEFNNSSFAANALYFKATTYLTQASKSKGSNQKVLFDKAHNAYVSTISFINERDSLTPGEKTILEVSYFQKAICQGASHNFGNAQQEYDLYLKNYPNGKYKCNAVFEQGNAYFSEQKFKQAVNKYENVKNTCNTDGFKGYLMSVARLGISLEKSSQIPKAKKVYAQCLQLCRSDKSQDACKLCKNRSEAVKIQY